MSMFPIKNVAAAPSGLLWRRRRFLQELDLRLDERGQTLSPDESEELAEILAEEEMRRRDS